MTTTATGPPLPSRKAIKEVLRGQAVALVAHPQFVAELRRDPWSYLKDIGQCNPEAGFLILKEIARLECLEAAARWRFEEQRFQGSDPQPIEEWKASTELMFPRPEVVAAFEKAFQQIAKDLLDEWVNWPDFVKPRGED